VAPATPPAEAPGGLAVSYAAASPAAPLCAVVHEGGSPAPAGSGLVVRLPLVQLGGEPVAELWHAPGAFEAGTEDGLAWAATEHLLFGAFELPAGDGARLEASARAAYLGALRRAGGLGYPHLLRTWNVVPWINGVDQGLERYRSFCRGRAEAFEAHHGSGFEPLLPASSAVGSGGGSLVMWFLASRLAGSHRENPRQVSAYAYPPRYGPRSPSFARATRCPAGRLLVSGTASIVGHRSVHPGEVERQLDETLDNLGYLLNESERLRSVRVYVRRPADAPRVRRQLEARLGTGVQAVYLQADICREELLVEVEGIG
jgi:chorismate lyase/3-hydroxybenzoate synthase